MNMIEHEYIACRAIEIADDACRSDVESYGTESGNSGEYGLVDEQGFPARSLDKASAVLRDAIDWLLLRGRARLLTAADGATRVVVLTDPDPTAVRPPSFGPWLTAGVDPDPATDAAVLADSSGACGHVVLLSGHVLTSEAGKRNHPGIRRFAYPIRLCALLFCVLLASASAPATATNVAVYLNDRVEAWNGCDGGLQTYYVPTAAGVVQIDCDSDPVVYPYGYRPPRSLGNVILQVRRNGVQIEGRDGCGLLMVEPEGEGFVALDCRTWGLHTRGGVDQ